MQTGRVVDMAGVLDATREISWSLREDAGRVEREGVERRTLDQLAAAGLYGISGPLAAGGIEAPAGVYREVAECLSGADGNTWLVWFQHHPVVKMLAASENTELAGRWLPGLCAGTVQAGVAFSNLRNPVPSLTARSDGGGWRITGRQPWCTGWGLIDVVLVGAATDDGEVVFALVPAAEAAGLRPTGELPLAAMGGTHTVALELDRFWVDPADVVVRASLSEWSFADGLRAANVQPSVFGIALAALEALAEQAPVVATPLAEALHEVRSRAYRLADEAPSEAGVEERLAAAAEAILLGVEVTTALVASLGGRAMALTHPAQRWAREAVFHLVFAQTAALRSATLAAVSRT